MNQMIYGSHLLIRKGIFQKLPQSNWVKGNTFACVDPQNSQRSTASQALTWVFWFHTEIDLIQLTRMPRLYPHLNCQVKQFFYGKFLCSLERERSWLRCFKEEICFLRNRQLSLLKLYCPWNLQGYLPLEHTALFRNILQHSWNNHTKILCESVPESGKLCPTIQLCPTKLILIQRGLLSFR